jgi:glucose-6-phosphate isomerase
MADSFWDRFCTLLIEEPVLGFRLDASRMPLRESDLELMGEPLRLAIAAMQELENGAIANPDEGRRVGHYWLRDADLAPDDAIADAIRSTRDRITSFAAAVHAGDIRPPASDAASSERFRNLLLVGIGGSALGPQLVADALARPDDPIRSSFIDNTDPDGIDRILDDLGDGLVETLILIVSKSGGTKETRNGMLEVREALKRRRLAFGPRAVAITGEGSSLHTYAREERFLDIFPMWDWVGGRTSVTSAVGLLPAALQGIDIDAFLGGARRMDVATRAADLRANPAAMLALTWFLAGNGRGDRDMVILPYKDRLVLLSRYLQQLVMESLGKERDLRGEVVSQGLSVYGNKGSTDQHAYVQQLREGPDNFFVTFIEVLRDRAGDSLEVEPGITAGDYLTGFLLGTREALGEKGRASVTITIPEVSPMTLGALIALFERTVGLYAALIGVNAYHQPGVEAGKHAAGRVLEMQRRVLEILGGPGAEALTATELAARLETSDQTLTLFHVLEHLAANGRLRVIRGTPCWTSRYALR